MSNVETAKIVFNRVRTGWYIHRPTGVEIRKSDSGKTWGIFLTTGEKVGTAPLLSLAKGEAAGVIAGLTAPAAPVVAPATPAELGESAGINSDGDDVRAFTLFWGGREYHARHIVGTDEIHIVRTCTGCWSEAPGYSGMWNGRRHRHEDTLTFVQIRIRAERAGRLLDKGLEEESAEILDLSAYVAGEGDARIYLAGLLAPAVDVEPAEPVAEPVALAESTDDARYAATLVTAGTRKVHLAFAWQGGRPTCDKTETVVETLATIAGEGLEGTIEALRGASVAQSRLCKNCFPIRTRIAYRNALTLAAGWPATEPAPAAVEPAPPVVEPVAEVVGAGADRAVYCGTCSGWHIAGDQVAKCHGLSVQHPDAGELDGVTRWATKQQAQAAGVEYTRRLDAEADAEQVAEFAQRDEEAVRITAEVLATRLSDDADLGEILGLRGLRSEAVADLHEQARTLPLDEVRRLVTRLRAAFDHEKHGRFGGKDMPFGPADVPGLVPGVPVYAWKHGGTNTIGAVSIVGHLALGVQGTGTYETLRVSTGAQVIARSASVGRPDTYRVFWKRDGGEWRSVTDHDLSAGELASWNGWAGETSAPPAAVAAWLDRVVVADAENREWDAA